MSPREFDDLLTDWSFYVFRGNRFPLGHVTSRFSEYVPKGAFGSDPADKIRPDVLRWDAFYRETLPAEFREVLFVEYLVTKEVRQRLVGAQVRSGQWKFRLRAAKTAALAMFHNVLEVEQVR